LSALSRGPGFLQSEKILIPLSEELRIVKAYLEIERLRLGPRLQTELQVEADAEHTMIPILSIQPLVENAIKHGISKRADAGWLRICATSSDGWLKVVVEDSGPGAEAGSPTSQREGEGVGLANVSRRLQLCFGPDAGVAIEQGSFGARVQFSVPLAQAASSRR
jgi:two-component system sensor histidine kinase LytS